MDYNEELKKIDGISGAVIASLVGIDGLSLASYSKIDQGDVSVMDAELASLMSIAKQSLGAVNAGEIVEIVVFASRYSFVLTFIGKEYYLYIGLEGKSASVGKARMLLYDLKKAFYKDLYG